MSEMTPFHPTGEIAPSVRALLAIFNADTGHKLSLAPVDSRPKVHQADGTVCEVDEYGWPDSSDMEAPTRGLSSRLCIGSRTAIPPDTWTPFP